MRDVWLIARAFTVAEALLRFIQTLGTSQRGQGPLVVLVLVRGVTAMILMHTADLDSRVMDN